MRDDVIVNVGIASVGIGLLVVGVCAIASPEAAAAIFGIPLLLNATEARAFVRATATRDVAIGCWFLILLALRVPRQILGASLIVAALVPIGDFINVFSSTINSTMALLLHGGSSVVFLACGVWLWRTR